MAPKAVFGLGNPGGRYRDTRHNVGFRVLDRLASRRGLAFDRKLYKSLVAVEQAAGGPVLWSKPQTYMNLSGEAVRDVAGFYKVGPEEMLVVVDDLALPLGKLRARRGGSHGGHNGLRSIAECLGTDGFSRLRVGVGAPAGGRDAADHVLSRFAEEERARIAKAEERAADAVETWLGEGIEAVMNRFNRDPEADGPTEGERDGTGGAPPGAAGERAGEDGARPSRRGSPREET